MWEGSFHSVCITYILNVVNVRDKALLFQWVLFSLSFGVLGDSFHEPWNTTSFESSHTFDINTNMPKNHLFCNITLKNNIFLCVLCAFQEVAFAYKMRELYHLIRQELYI